jgi:glycosyltransferase involved in cell wall biosynthesis
MLKRLKIAYVTMYDGTNISNWSGTGYYISLALQKYVGDVTYIGNLRYKKYIDDYIRKIFNKAILKKTYRIERTQRSGEYYAEQVSCQLKRQNYDLIFSPGTMEIAYLDTSLPIVVYIDATFNSMVGYYWKNLAMKTITDGNRMEATALGNTARILCASQWAADSVITDYNVDKNKVFVIPFGANLNQIPESHTLKRTNSETLNILFIGMDWIRKGGSIAYETVMNLRKKNINAILHIVGCNPQTIKNDSWVKVHGFLNKQNSEHSSQLNALFQIADYLLLPSREECAGIVIGEANAYGVPVLAHKTGGIPSMVVHGENGYLSESNTADEYTKFILSTISDSTYSKLRQEARLSFESKLNWEVCGKSISKIVQDLFNGN